MKTYAVEIKVTIRKTYKVEAENETEATEKAHDIFSVLTEDDVDEEYDEETLSVEEVETTQSPSGEKGN